MFNITIKKFNQLSIEDLYSALKLRSEIFVVEQACIYQDIDDMDQSAYHLICKDEKENVIAYLRIVAKTKRFPEISIGRVIVAKDYRRFGLGGKMMKAAIDFIEKELNETEIRISAQAYLLDFYSSLNFIKCSDVYLEDNIKHYEMFYKKDLKTN